jgi:hypothetical protein
MLCQHCEISITATSKAPKTATLGQGAYQNVNSLQYSPSSISRSAKEGCFICRQIWDSILESINNFSDYVDDSELDGGFTLESETIAEWWNSGNSTISFTMYSSEGYISLSLTVNQRRGIDFVLIPIPTNRAGAGADTDSSIKPDPVSGAAFLAAGTLELYSHWFRTCSESHTKCRKLERELQPFAPERLIEISTEDGNSFSWRLVCPADIGNVPYFALSHCWGTSRRICLTTKNRRAFAEFTPFSDLPKTYQHAFLVTFSLGFRFIWIDSLCIVQDDDEDWKAQASMMRSVYKGACCDIAATWAANGDGGCFIPIRAPTLITLDLGLGQPIAYEVSLKTQYYDDLVEAPLNTRGWVVQERYLARKQLSFTRSGVYWECHELVASERFPTSVPDRLRDFSPYGRDQPPTGKPTLDLNDPSTLRRAWAVLVDFYSDCEFTRLSDKTVALAGLADEVRRITGDVYLAGLWKKDLAKQLCWATDCDVRRRAKRVLTPTYLAPTWSWVSVDGPVLSDPRYLNLGIEDVSCIEVLDVSDQSEHFSQLHSFTSSKLVLRGIALFARAMRVGRSVGQLDVDNWEFHFTNLAEIGQSCIAATTEVSIMWDENLPYPEASPERWSSFLKERQSKFLCMLVSISSDEVTAYNDDEATAYGLILRMLPDATDGVAYVRMGTFTSWHQEFFDLLCARLKIPPGESIDKDIDLGDVSLADIVHSVAVV